MTTVSLCSNYGQLSLPLNKFMLLEKFILTGILEYITSCEHSIKDFQHKVTVLLECLGL